MRILIVEDHPETRTMLAEVLSGAGYVADTAATLEEARSVVSEEYDGIILDWMLPDGAGLDLCRELRSADRTTPVLMLTARGDVVDRVAGLDAGADDYLRKPFAVAELLARLRALLRRGDQLQEAVIRVGAATIDLTHRRVTVNGRDIVLTAREFALVECLVCHDGAASRSTILRQVWQQETPGAASSLEVLISRLRKKLSTEKLPFPIRTHRGFGYSIETGP